MARPTPTGRTARAYPRAGAEKAIKNLHASMFVDPEEGEFGYFPHNHLAMAHAYDVLGAFGPAYGGYVPENFVVTGDNSSTFVYTDATANGILGTITNNSNNDLSIGTILEWTPVVNKAMVATLDFQLNDGDDTSLIFGFVSDGTLDTTAPADGVFFNKAASALTGVITARGNAGTAASTATAFTITEGAMHRLTLQAMISTTAANNVLRAWFDGTEIAQSLITAAMRTQMAAIMTTPTDLIGFVGFRGQDETVVAANFFAAVTRFTIAGAY